MRHCRIPKAGQGCNVFHGEFVRRGQTDWEVFCFSDTSSSLLIFWGGTGGRVEKMLDTSTPSRTAKQSDPCYFRAARPGVIRTYLRYWTTHPGQGAAPPPAIARVTHDGIEENLGGGATAVHYRHGGKWMVLEGMD